MAKLTMKMVFDEDNSGGISPYKNVELIMDLPNDSTSFDYAEVFRVFLHALTFPMDNREVKIVDTDKKD